MSIKKGGINTDECKRPIHTSIEGAGYLVQKKE